MRENVNTNKTKKKEKNNESGGTKKEKKKGLICFKSFLLEKHKCKEKEEN